MGTRARACGIAGCVYVDMSVRGCSGIPAACAWQQGVLFTLWRPQSTSPELGSLLLLQAIITHISSLHGPALYRLLLLVTHFG